MKSAVTLSSRERVLLSLGRQPSDRPAFSWSFGPQPTAKQALDEYLAQWNCNYDRLYQATCDIRQFGPAYNGPPLPPQSSIWGWTNKTISYGAGSYEEWDFRPLANAETVADIERHPWPNPDHFNYADLRPQIREVDPEHRYARVLWVGNPMEILSWMMGLEKLMEALVIAPEVVHVGMERITAFFEELARRCFAAAPGEFDAVFGADDVGTQQGPMIGRPTYRELIMPYHRRLYGLSHEHVRFTIHHSDGSVYDLLDDLHEAGVDCLEAVQVECRDMEPEKLKAGFGDRLAFQGAVSVQQVLPQWSVEEVKKEVRRLKSVLGQGGGYICAPSHAIQAGTPVENVIAMVEAALETPFDQIIAQMQRPL